MPGAPPDTTVQPGGTTTIHTLPASSAAGASDTVALPFQGVTGGVPAPVVVPGTVAVTQGGVITVQPGNTANTVAWKVDGSGVTQPASLASVPLAPLASTSTLQPTNAAQGSTTSGQTGTLAQGAVTTAPPTYTTAQTSPLSLDLAGNLRVNVVTGGGTGGTSSTFGAAFPGPGTAIGAKNGANMVFVGADASNNLNVNLQTALPPGTNALGSIIGRTTQVTVTPTVTSNGAYTAGQEIGGLMTFAIGGAGSGTLMSACVTSRSILTTALKLYLFSTNPAGTTWTDKTTPAIVAADIGTRQLCYVLLNNADSGLGTHTIWDFGGIGVQFVGANLYGVLVAVSSATLTSSSTSDITVQLGISDD